MRWTNLFSKKFRAECLARIMRRGLSRSQRFMEIIGGLISTVVGLGLPVLIIHWIFFTNTVAASVRSAVILVLLLALLHLNPVRWPDSWVRSYVLHFTPIGTTIDDVEGTVRKKKWRINYIDRNSPLWNQSTDERIGAMSLRASLGDYRPILFPLFEANVTVIWGFDKSGSLLDIWVWRTVNAL